MHIQVQSLRLPEAVIQSSPKITRGENYQLLPYVILDYPRCFQKEQVFAIRTMFWWGKGISITLHVSGNVARMAALADLRRFHHVATELSNHLQLRRLHKVGPSTCYRGSAADSC